MCIQYSKELINFWSGIILQYNILNRNLITFKILNTLSFKQLKLKYAIFDNINMFTITFILLIS